MKFVDLTGKRFGRLIVSKMAGREPKHGQSLWECVCDCGTVKPNILYTHLRSSTTQSCGCLAVELAIKASTTHGMSKTPEWTSYHGAKKRCNPEFAHNHPDYAGRGIEFRFNSFEEFYAEVGPRPEPKFDHSLERIENDGHYEKGNIKWATKKQQARNRRCDRCEKLFARVKELEALLAEKS